MEWCKVVAYGSAVAFATCQTAEIQHVFTPDIEVYVKFVCTILILSGIISAAHSGPSKEDPAKT